MSWKLEAAYHEAGHALLASISPFHAIISPINLARYGAGDIYISLSKKKCIAAGKLPVPETARDEDVAKDFALILVAGLVAERIASEYNDEIVPSLACAKPDHDLLIQNLSEAGLSKKFDKFEEQAAEALRNNWGKVEKLAAALNSAGTCSPEQVAEHLSV